MSIYTLLGAKKKQKQGVRWHRWRRGSHGESKHAQDVKAVFILDFSAPGDLVEDSFPSSGWEGDECLLTEQSHARTHARTPVLVSATLYSVLWGRS